MELILKARKDLKIGSLLSNLDTKFILNLNCFKL